MKLTINTDGASRGNPGPASYGFVIKDEKGVVLYKEGKTLGVTTNNVAEYTAVLRALEYVVDKLKLEIKQVNVITDSQLIASQLSGKFKIKSPHLYNLFQDIKDIEKMLPFVSYQNVPREFNKDADHMANLALDGKI